ncbi:DUF3426 domain-containing protein [Marinobacter zhanjiangensis]|uniref:Zinc finger/thioredoxin putative domain-containing protein n=1 Tax=Marinobacter zhanjiangensis TaxID=578215 RepID=A0ABQ3B435_9GAMM|nr:DUF3426 domain-containing protein [Marinobacter zhanjiangensis]GGY73712.1 hypothetical protein GCM10007071_21230 [Marinobacter zhanjiangensis]
MADTSSLLTRCPHCDTRFRVTDEQLAVANGKVRCGHCMEVFDARAHADTGTDNGMPSDETESYESFSAADPDDDIIFEDNPEEDAVEGHYAGQKAGFADEELSDSFRDGGAPGEGPGMGDDEDTEDVDESWAEAMLQEEFPDAPPRAASDSHPANRNEEPRAPAGQTPTPTRRPPEPEHSAGEPEPTRHDAPQSTDDLELTEITAAPPPEEAPAGPARRQDATTGGTFPPLDDFSPYEQLSREPVAVHSRKGGGLRGALWTLVVLALIAGLVSQVAWFQFDRLAAIPELRPWYEKACEYAGCELEPLVAMDRIQSRKLVVRTDPENRSALLVDAVIINQAEFEQPFPSIALTFSNLNGDVVAQSIFPPEDYLEGEGTDLSTMPPGTPVRIAISIRDPGRDAVNYNLRFVNRGNDS